VVPASVDGQACDDSTAVIPPGPRAAAVPCVLGPADYQALYVHGPEGVLFTAPDGAVLAANPAACTILAMTEEEICRAGRPGLADPDDPRWDALVALRDRHGHATGVARMRRGDGSFAEIEMSAQIFTDDVGRRRTCTVLRDVTERVALEERLQAMAARLHELSMTDELTGLRNRRAAMTLGAQLVDLADRQRQQVQILFVDVDGLKARNDTFGHAAGDSALRAVATALAAAFRRSDVVARIGGDEFLVVAMGVDALDRAALEHRLRRSLAGTDGTVAGGRVQVSLGWVTRPVGDPTPFETWVSRADHAMYSTRVALPDQRASHRSGPTC
jgi:diguanylate cyclase (GGDEF)-like protein/PAS domain S-box-containing protein